MDSCKQITEMKNMILTVGLLTTALYAGISCTAQHKDHLNAVEFKEAIQAESALLIDVRTQNEVRQGAIPGAKHVDFYQGGFVEAFADIPKDKPIYLYCHSGQRSGQALAQLKKAGFTQVAHLQGGILSWRQMGGPEVKLDH
jgi:phage shock protein E